MTTPTTDDRPGLIDARPVPHPGRWVALAIIVILIAMMISSFVTNPRWDFAKAFEIMVQTPVLEGLVKGTIVGTIGAMVIGIIGGVLIAILRLSTNPVLRGVSFVYTWFFRGIPRLVLLAMIGSGIGFLYSKVDFGVPFGQQFASWLGLSQDFTFFTLNVNQFSSTLLAGIVGLGLSEAAYMAEIARAGILSVDKGQAEAAAALGMSRGKAMRRIVLPQAMRVIVPPTGNEAIAMVKDTSLLSAIPIITELFYQTSAIGNRTLLIMPAFVAATIWYLLIGSVMMVGQYFLEKRFGRGFGTKPTNKRFARPAGAGGA
ncbi:polar amino acid transport system permease protein [Humibacillus xanthopallidus]|uniref:Polar amino acid transport system permease protein n=1 Tax=Humibacillus xanthopallidus TaxID=412689 RepID=A0A543PLM0_9MICO|nr:amino acid ABC transporter permease [Humibacillus xanthopallidus]TQN44976.1 polar amino acid transport system permease protein [Humibacillus xanthopallidus]